MIMLYRSGALLAAALLVSSMLGCVEDEWWDLPQDLVTTDSVSIDGTVYVISPYGNRVISIDSHTQEIASLEVGKNPRVLTTDDTVDGPKHLFTINQDDSTMSIVDVAEWHEHPDSYTAAELSLKPFFDQLVFSPSGEMVISYIGTEVTEADLVGQGSVNPNEVAIIDLLELTVAFVTLESRPTDVIFTDDGALALLPTRTGVEVVEPYLMPGGDPISYPFSSDLANPVTPSVLRVSPNADLAFAAAPGNDVVYVLDLLDPSFNLISTGWVPDDIAITGDGSTTVVVGGTGQALYFDNAAQAEQTLDVGTPVDTIVLHRVDREGLNEDELEDIDPDFAILYNTSVPQRSFAIVTFDEDVPEVDTYATDESITRIDIDPTGQTAVIFHGDSGWGSGRLSMFNLESRYPATILLESPPHDMTFLPTEDATVEPVGYVMVVLKESGKLVRYSLSSYGAAVVGVAENPEVVRSVHGDPYLVHVVHEEPLGLMTFLNPYRPLALPGGFPTVYGYGLTGILD
jgi:hypothetical protein